MKNCNILALFHSIDYFLQTVEYTTAIFRTQSSSILAVYTFLGGDVLITEKHQKRVSRH